MSEPVNPNNKYDNRDLVRRGATLIASGLKLATYQTRTPGGEFSEEQFHFTWDNTVVALLDKAGVDDLKTVLIAAKALTLEEGEVRTYHQPSGTFSVYLDDGAVGIQIRRGELVLGKLGLAMAELMVGTAEKSLFPPEFVG